MYLRLNVLRVLIVILGIGFSSFHLYGQGSPNVVLLDQLDDYAIGYNDCWGYTAPDSREYALLGVINGTSIIDITNAGSATEITFIPSPSSTWKDIKTYQNYAYVVTESSGGMQIIDLSNLPSSATLVSTYTGFSTSHNIYIDEPNAMLYAEGSGSIRAISLADPENPVELSTFGISSHDIYARDNIVYVSEGSNGSIGIFDLSNPASPTMISRFQIPNAGFVHNAWLTDDGNYLMTTEETTNKTVKLFDIQDLNNVFIADEYLGPSNLAHNTHIKGNYAYISHYADGLKIVDISDPSNIFEAGFYDTTPSTGGFTGSWGAFPFFPSGKILASDFSNGLFVFSFTPPASLGISITVDPAAGDPVIVPGSGRIFNFDVTIENNGSSTLEAQTWNKVTLVGAGGEEVGPVGGIPVTNITVAANSSFTTTITLEVPPGVPAGTYPFNQIVGTFPSFELDRDTFTFIKTAGPSLTKAGTDDWGLSPKTEVTIPEEFALEQNFPNPFNPSTTIAYQIPTAETVRMTIYDLTGRQVRELLNENKSAGYHTIQWDGKNQIGQQVSSGLYIYQISAGKFNQTRKMAFVK